MNLSNTHQVTTESFHPLALVPASEARLATGAVRLDDGSFELGLAGLLPDLRRRARGLLRNAERAEDLVQDTVERALRFRDSFRSGSYLRAWVMRILHNVFISQRRRVTTERRILEGAGVDPNGWARHEPALLLPGLSPRVQQAMLSLPERLREVVRLVDLEEHSYREAAEQQNVPVGTVMSRLHRGRARLAETLREAAIDDLHSRDEVAQSSDVASAA